MSDAVGVNDARPAMGEHDTVGQAELRILPEALTVLSAQLHWEATGWAREMHPGLGSLTQPSGRATRCGDAEHWDQGGPNCKRDERMVHSETPAKKSVVVMGAPPGGALRTEICIWMQRQPPPAGHN